MGNEEIIDKIKDLKLFIIPYSHMDWAWTHSRLWHELRYNLVLEEVIQCCQEIDDFKWFFDNYSEFIRAVEKHRPELLNSLKQMIEKGKVEIAGPYAGLRNSQPAEETFIRNLIMGKEKMLELFGDNISPVYVAADVGIGHSQLPQLLRQAGYKYYRGWRPEKGMDAQGIPAEFYWQGLDGSQILTSRGTYAGPCALIEESFSPPDETCSNWDRLLKVIYERDIYRHFSVNSGSVVWVAQGMDDSLPLTRFPDDRSLPFKELVDNLQAMDIDINFGLPGDYFKTLAESSGRIPVISGVIDPTEVCYEIPWHGKEGLWPLRDSGDRLLVEAEIWNTISSIKSDHNYPAEELKVSWEDLLLSNAHATQWLFEEDYQKVKHTCKHSVHKGKELREMGENSCLELTTTEKDCLVLFNPEPYKFTGCVELDFEVVHDFPDDIIFVDENGREIPTQLLTTRSYPEHNWVGLESATAVIETEIPAGGYKTVFWQQGESLKSDKGSVEIIDNGRLELAFTGGVLKKITDLANNQVYQARDGKSWNKICFEEMEDTGAIYIGPITEHRSMQIEDSYLSHNGPLYWSHTAEGKIGNNQIRVVTSVYRDNPFIQFSVEIVHQQGTGEYVAVFPFADEGEIYTDIPFGVEKRGLTDELYNSGEEEYERKRPGQFWAKSWVAYQMPSDCLSIVSIDGDKYYRYHNQSQELKYILFPALEKRGNSWEQRIASSITGRGEHEFNYGLLVGDENWRESKPWRVASNFRHPVHSLQLPAGYRPIKIEKSFFQCDPDNVMLSAFYRDNQNYILRIYETAGQETGVRIKLPAEPARIEFVNLEGNPINDKKATIKGKTICFNISPWKIKNLQLDFTRSDQHE